MIEVDRPTEMTVSDAETLIYLTQRSNGPSAESVLRMEVVNDEVQQHWFEIGFLVEFLRQEDDGFVAHVPALPSASSQGANIEEAQQAVRENLAGILEAEGEGIILPPDRREYLAGPKDYVATVTLRRDAAA